MNVFASGGQYTFDDAGEVTGELWDASNAEVRNDASGMQWVPVILSLPGEDNDDGDGSCSGALTHYFPDLR